MLFIPQKELDIAEELAKKKPNLTGQYYITDKPTGQLISIAWNSKKWECPKNELSEYIPSLSHIRNELTLLKKPIAIPFILLMYINKDAYWVDDIIPTNKPYTMLDRLGLLRNLNLTEQNKLFKLPTGVINSYDKQVWDKLTNESKTTGIVAKRLTSYYANNKCNSDLIKQEKQE